MAEAPNVTDIWCAGGEEKRREVGNKLHAGFSNLTLPLLPTESSPSAIKRGLGNARVFMECHLVHQNPETNERFGFSTNGWGSAP